jgi:hypothetical protein
VGNAVHHSLGLYIALMVVELIIVEQSAEGFNRPGDLPAGNIDLRHIFLQSIEKGCLFLQTKILQK